VIEFERFLSPAEVERLLDVCDNQFRPSVHDSAESEGARAQQQIRTSSQCHYQPRAGCSDPRCRRDPVLQRIFERIADVTGAPLNNLGATQIVRYHAGEYYSTHHDQTHFMEPPLPEGARVLTFFMYLNDVPSDAGGATRFPDLDDLRVRPRTGKALLWPSVTDGDANATELFTFHEAMPVTSGVKFAANVWVHQFDYVTPREVRRCGMGSFAAGSVDPRWEACQRLERRPEGRCAS